MTVDPSFSVSTAVLVAFLSLLPLTSDLVTRLLTPFAQMYANYQMRVVGLEQRLHAAYTTYAADLPYADSRSPAKRDPVTSFARLWNVWIDMKHALEVLYRNNVHLSACDVDELCVSDQLVYDYVFAQLEDIKGALVTVSLTETTFVSP